MTGGNSGPPAFSGLQGKTYTAFSRRYRGSFFCGFLPLEDEGLAVAPLPERLLDQRLGGLVVKRFTRLGECVDRLREYVSCPVDVACHQGQSVGLVVSFMDEGMDLLEYLAFAAYDDKARALVAHNLCSLVQFASERDFPLGRLAPGRILVNPSDGRVFLAIDFLSLAKGGRLQECDAENLLLREWKSDLALHVYSLLRGRRGAELERTLWAESGVSGLKGPGEDAMEKAVFATVRVPLSAKWAQFWREMRGKEDGKGEDDLRAVLWNVPREFRAVLADALSDEGHGSASALASELCDIFVYREQKKKRWYVSLAEKVKLLAGGTGVSRADVMALERRPWGLRGNGQTSTFWLTTLWFSAALGICSAVNGFAPLDVLAHVWRGSAQGLSEASATWQYVVAALAGSAAYNVFIARRHPLDGYRKESYCWSVATGILFMSLTKAMFALLRAGGAL